MPYLSLTTFSLHRNLGSLRFTRWDEEKKSHIVAAQDQPETLSLLELPPAIAKRGIQALEVCHFNFPQTDADYLVSLREAFTSAGVTFDSLLIDYGDISTSDDVRREADLAFIRGWIDVAAKAGAKRVRIVAGEAQPSDTEALQRSAAALTELAAYADSVGVRAGTENFRALSSTADNCLYLVEQGQGKVGLTADFGNFAAPGKYDALARIVPIAESVHAKAHYDEAGMPDREEFVRCLEIAKQAGYEGPIVLVYDGPGDQWAGIERIASIVTGHFSR